ncbi:MBL fold metallo-hydrolase [Coprothermobacteraceae bacterium]|nr:MBL fold metallo-hydrolase [Coprothermobacteraceae bacterium]
MKIRKLAGNSLTVLSALILVGLLAIIPLFQGTPYKGISAHFFDVGQGLSVLIRLPEGKTLLYDAGPYSAKNTIISYLKSQGVKRIDYLVFSHPDADHIGAGADVINSFELGAIYMPRVSNTTKTFENLLRAIQTKKLAIKEAKAGVAIAGPKNTIMQFIGPVSYDRDILNNSSAVLLISFGSFSILLTGDAEKPELSSMQDAFSIGEVTVFQVPHHGSYGSLDEEFYRTVKPKYAVVSVGDNDYGHPNPRVIKALEAAGAKVYRTDLNGHIVISSDGKTVRIRVQR